MALLLKEAGHALAELIIVLAILGIVLSVANLSLEPATEQKVEAASTEIVDAIFFAQNEALRTGKSVGVLFGEEATLGASRNMFTVFVQDSAGHRTVAGYPATSRPYQVDLNQAPFGNGVSVASADFDRGHAVFFTGALGRAGTPSSSGQVTVSLGAVSRTVTVDAETGRISRQ